MQKTLAPPVIESQAAHYGDELAPLKILRGARLTSLFQRRDAERSALKRIEDEEVSWITEALNAHFETEYTFGFDGENLLTSDGHSFRELLLSGLKNAQEIAAAHPYYAGFVMDRSRAEYDNHLRQLGMADENHPLPNTMIEFSAMPTYANLEEEQLLRSLGNYKVDRSMGIIRISAWNAAEQKMTLYSYSVDNANVELFAQVANIFGHDIPDGLTPEQLLAYPLFLDLPAEEQRVLADRLVAACDATLSQLHGRTWKAGREQLSEADSFNFVRSQRNVIQELMKNIRKIDKKKSLSEPEKKSLLRVARLGAVALIDARFNGRTHSGSITQQMARASSWASSEQKVYDGCGLILSAEEKQVLLSYSLLSMNTDPTKCVTCPYCEEVVDLPKEDYEKGILHCTACDKAYDKNKKEKISNYSKKKQKKQEEASKLLTQKQIDKQRKQQVKKLTKKKPKTTSFWSAK